MLAYTEGQKIKIPLTITPALATETGLQLVIEDVAGETTLATIPLGSLTTVTQFEEYYYVYECDTPTDHARYVWTGDGIALVRHFKVIELEDA